MAGGLLMILNMQNRTMLTNTFLLALSITVISFTRCSGVTDRDLFPDGTPVPEWFRDTSKVTLDDLGRQFRITTSEWLPTAP
jgi:hypothetical protein